MAFRKAAVFLGAFLVPALCQDENVTEDAGGMEIKFRGKSGKFSVYSKAEGEKDPNKITFEIDEFIELDANEAEVGGGKGQSHSFKDFKKTEFSFTQDTDANIGTASGAKVAFSSNMSGLGTFAVDTYLIKSEGVVGPDLEDPESPTWSVYPGDVKFNIEIKDWQWCRTVSCGTEGEFIDVSLEMKGKNVKKEAKGGKGGGSGKKKSKAIEMGGGIDMEFSGEYLLDGENATMPDGFPLVEIKGSKTTVTFRFSKFNTSVMYDPAVFTSDSDSIDPTFLGASILRLPFGFAFLLLLVRDWL